MLNETKNYLTSINLTSYIDKISDYISNMDLEGFAILIIAIVISVLVAILLKKILKTILVVIIAIIVFFIIMNFIGWGV